MIISFLCIGISAEVEVNNTEGGEAKVGSKEETEKEESSFKDEAEGGLPVNRIENKDFKAFQTEIKECRNKMTFSPKEMENSLKKLIITVKK